MLILKLALRNILGAGLRTWLNVTVLSFSFVIIIWLQGFYIGMLEQVSDATIDAEFGGGQYWNALYDPFDPLSLKDAHSPIQGTLKDLVDSGRAAPVLIVLGTIYPGGRIMPVLLKGIDPRQAVVSLPSRFLEEASEDLPVLIGTRMAENAGLETGDTITIQWRDTHGTFDALEARIVQVMETIVPTIDNGQMWLPLEKLRAMTLLENEATLVVIAKDVRATLDEPNWIFKNLDFLLSDIKQIVQMRTIGSAFIYAFLLLLAMLAIFNTQVLSIFRRRKEMGTLMALGFNRTQVIELFTMEGALQGVFAAVVAAIYGIPLLILSAKGFGLPSELTSQSGFALGAKLFPSYTAGLVVGTTLIVLIMTTIVSFLPTRKIAKLKPTDALRGKLP
ncbi:MAG: ABC transporter permease [Candidatus Aminicenantes bacterium]|nr:ABC transporter permease [Candidatus Aminicenantes bacterium]